MIAAALDKFLANKANITINVPLVLKESWVISVAEMYPFLSDDVIHLYDIVISDYTTRVSVVVTFRSEQE